MDTIRLATPNDAEAILAIYAPIVQHSVISFEFSPPRLETMQQRIQSLSEQFPWLVLEQESHLLGYAYASRHSERAAYQWATNVSVYVHAEARRQGVAQRLYTSLFAILRAQGFYLACAGITLPNPASVALHESVGFEPVGVYREVGYKFGAWHDVGWWQHTLQPRVADPRPPRAMVEEPSSSA
ncbi:MAG: N-acetyltransferase [Ardenticatenales bacterium]|nr:N-acetyltransferase [Ardenticatenales bacterium]